MRRSTLLLALLLTGCFTQIGGPQWATVTHMNDRGAWGCWTSVITDRGMLLTRRGCSAPEGTRVCVQAVRAPRFGEPAGYHWEPSSDCDPDE